MKTFARQTLREPPPDPVAGRTRHSCAACGSTRLFGTLCRHRLRVGFCGNYARPHWHGWCLDCNDRSIYPY
jgi:ribosomal protein S14